MPLLGNAQSHDIGVGVSVGGEKEGNEEENGGENVEGWIFQVSRLATGETLDEVLYHHSLVLQHDSLRR